MSDSLVHAVAGATGGVVSMALTYPLITVSTRSQVNSKEQKQSQIDTVRQIVREEGFSGLYSFDLLISGLNSALVGISVTSAIYYFWYESIKAKFQARHAPDEGITVLENMVTGTIAGTITSISTNPIWVINTRLLVKDKSAKKQSFFEAVESIKKEDGIAGFFRGLGPALMLVSNPVIQYTVYERLLVYFDGRRKLTPVDYLVLGAVAKLCATCVTYPYIVVKSRMHLKDADTKYSSILDGFRKILKSEGISGLYKGIESKLVQSVTTAALMFMFKEQFYKIATLILRLIKKQQ